MAVLLMHICGSRTFNRTPFRPHLYIYDNILIYKKRHLFSQDEVTITYNHISWAKLHRMHIYYAHLEIVSTGMQKVVVKWIKKEYAIKAKHLIDQKIFNVHKKDNKQVDIKEDKNIIEFELSLKRLQELLSTGKISKTEFENRRKHLLKNNY
ncbi:hypothetical protein A2V49_01830 [candidate division WWE3 bacterium RBG_19FT_COMBO_34_6]|uniref:SHOCT domain-containing protein n=1 Tax=candidate division WWE3 bacterium RBG_19FT_COMBO_34_6 TaxID=1802612 RepID=A0A1F4UMR6_UNCKA|nr:MAG: hypothetical protein A2V49_01830 [candidate division WWE3 bacterium RBG_19FT_COMBO_34_6]